MKFLLDQDVWAATARFLRSLNHDSEAVNRALRGLITLVPAKRKTVKRRKAIAL